jgi:hypothetical protein
VRECPVQKSSAAAMTNPVNGRSGPMCHIRVRKP